MSILNNKINAMSNRPALQYLPQQNAVKLDAVSQLRASLTI